MKAILCDKCKKVLVESDKMIEASAVRYELGPGAAINREGISISVLTGYCFCSVKCLKESIK